MHPRILSLSVDQRAELERVRDRDERAYLREMAAGLLKVADGQSARHVALSSLLHPLKPETVCGWPNRYRATGLAGLVHRPRRGGGISPCASKKSSSSSVVNRPSAGFPTVAGGRAISKRACPGWTVVTSPLFS